MRVGFPFLLNHTLSDPMNPGIMRWLRGFIITSTGALLHSPLHSIYQIYYDIYTLITTSIYDTSALSLVYPLS